jgi:hypothetical protein
MSPRKNGFGLISQRLLSGFAHNFAQVLKLYRCPLQACFLCQKWPVDPSRKGTFRAEIHMVAGQRAFVAGASPGVRQLEKQKSPFPNLRLLFTKGATLSACPPPSTKTTPPIKHKFHVSCSTGLSIEARARAGFWPCVHAHAWRRAARFHCFFHNLGNIGNFSFFFGPRYISTFKRRE